MSKFEDIPTTVCPACGTDLSKVNWEEIEETKKLKPMSIDELARLRTGRFSGGEKTNTPKVDKK